MRARGLARAWRPIVPALALVLLTMVALQASSGESATQPADPPPANLAPPNETPAPCVSEACAAAIEAAIQRGASSKDAVLTSQLLQLADAERAARSKGKRISASDLSEVPPNLDGLVDANALHIDAAGRVQVFMEPAGQAGAATNRARDAGGTIERVNDNLDLVQAWVPIEELSILARSGEYASIRLPTYGSLQTGSVTAQSDHLLNAAGARLLFGVNGSGVSVGVISDGVEGLTQSQQSGDLPGVDIDTCNIVPQSAQAANAGAEGTAMLEIVHDLAPGAELWFGHWGAGFDGTVLDFIAAVNCLAAHVDIVVDDYAFFDFGAYDGSGPISMNAVWALNSPTNKIRGYYNAGGNFALQHYQAPFRNASSLGSAFAGEHLFAAIGASTSDEMDIGPEPADPFWMNHNAIACVLLQWNDQFGHSGNDYDLYLFDHDLLLQGSVFARVAASEYAQNGSQLPIEELCFRNQGAAGFYDIIIRKFGSPAVRTFDMFVLCSGCPPLVVAFGPIHNFNTRCSSVANNSDAGGGVIAGGVINAGDPGINTIEPYSSCGPTNDGRLKPEIVALDGVNVTGNGGFGSPFYGTSAAGPHIGAVAALLLDCDPSLSRAQLRSALLNTAINLGPLGPDQTYGYGRVNIGGALNAATCIDPSTPTPTQTATATNSPTVTLTPTITPTATPKNLLGDTDGDTVTNDLDDNDDADGCSDVQETGLVAAAGGLRDPHNFWDFYDVPTGAGLTRDGSVASTDIFGVLGRFNSAGSPVTDPLSAPGPAPEYHTAYDRGAIVGSNVWNVGPANGSVAATDIFAVIGQFNHSCALHLALPARTRS